MIGDEKKIVWMPVLTTRYIVCKHPTILHGIYYIPDRRRIPRHSSRVKSNARGHIIYFVLSIFKFNLMNKSKKLTFLIHICTQNSG